jgi:hypothetical protein
MPIGKRRVGLIEDDKVFDLTEINPNWNRIYSIFFEAKRLGKRLDEHILSFALRSGTNVLHYNDLIKSHPGHNAGCILSPLDHPDPAHLIITVTGLTHLGSSIQRDKMHKGTHLPKTDSEKMFQMGLQGGKPKAGVRGIQPECFQKGNGQILRGHNDYLDIPGFAEDGGEEPEIVGCYIIADDGIPHRIGFAIGNEWSDHAMEKVNYLWLGHSKQRTCSVGPELITDHPFKDVRGRCRIIRSDEIIYDSGELLTGEKHMNHSLKNLEDHLFKYPHYRIPGDVHLFFFGTMKFSYGDRENFQTGDKIEITFDTMGSPLINYVRHISNEAKPITVRKA